MPGVTLECYQRPRRDVQLIGQRLETQGVGKVRRLAPSFRTSSIPQFINLALESGGLLHSGNQPCGNRLTAGPEKSHDPNNSLPCLIRLTWNCFVGLVGTSHVWGFPKRTLEMLDLFHTCKQPWPLELSPGNKGSPGLPPSFVETYLLLVF